MNKRGVIKNSFIALLLIISFNLVSPADDFSSYNIEIDLPDEYENVVAGDKIWFATKIFNLVNKERIDIVLDYSLIDDAGAIINSKTETVAIQTQASFVGTLNIPDSAHKGVYSLEIQIVTKTGQAKTASVRINVAEKDGLQKFVMNNIFWIALFTFVLLLIITYIKFRYKIHEINVRLKIKKEVVKIIDKKIQNSDITDDDLIESRLPLTDVLEKKDKEEMIF